MRRSGLLLVIGCVLLGFLVAVAVRSRPADPSARLSREYRLADLIERKQASTATLRSEVESLRSQVEELRTERAGGEAVSADRERRLADVGLAAGLARMRGPGVRVTLDDSLLERAPSGNVNDLVVHSQDVQAVVNALWRSGAEAIAINGQRLVSTSAVLCVGNTLLLNGTVHSPPYAVAAVGAVRDRFDADVLVRRLHDDAEAYGLRFTVTREEQLEVPPYRGTTTMNYARPKS